MRKEKMPRNDTIREKNLAENTQKIIEKSENINKNIEKNQIENQKNTLQNVTMSQKVNEKSEKNIENNQKNINKNQIENQKNIEKNQKESQKTRIENQKNIEKNQENNTKNYQNVIENQENRKKSSAKTAQFMPKTAFVVTVVLAIFLIVSLVGVSYAMWTGSGLLPVNWGQVQYPNPTQKYLKFEIHNDKNQFFYVEFRDKADGNKGAFVYSSALQNDYLDGVTDSEFDFNSPLFAVAIGYSGMLGELEPLEIPAKISVFSTVFRDINVTKINMQSPEEFPLLNNITELVIPASITQISGVSFSYCQNLAIVNFANRAGVTINKDCFQSCPLLKTIIF
ncbi:MAG: leucine-rich repeat protein [Clostridia bacterium]